MTIKCPICGSCKIDQLTPITNTKNKPKFFHTVCLDCNKELRVNLDGSISDEITHDNSWLDDLSNLIE